LPDNNQIHPIGHRVVEVDGISLDTTSWLLGEGELSNSLLSLPVLVAVATVAGEDFRSLDLTPVSPLVVRFGPSVPSEIY